ncbi:MAG: N-acetyl sugar amidotransferase [bacterium]|nr:N-acetyl sugar amidotransferase [bacterium]
MTIKKQEIIECSHCVLDTHDDPTMTFDANGVCNYCRNYKKNYVDNAITLEEKRQILERQLNLIKNAKNGPYDTILGVSGGVDSTYAAYVCKQLGLNPLLVHFDNGWNSEQAVSNIEQITKNTGFDLYTYVVDWPEFRDLQLAYIKASVLDWEIPSDHGFFAILYRLANKFNIKYILTGHNHQTEAILPKTMRHNKMDVDNIIDIHKQFGKLPIKTYPLLGFWRFNYYLRIKKIERFNLLEYIEEYNKDKAKQIIIKEMGWKDYGGKHYESIFTRFYQGYVLKEKFGFEKRKAHLANLICSGQITKEEAKAELALPVYNETVYKVDRNFVLKKLGLNEEQFQAMMNEPVRSHLEFKSYMKGLYLKHEKFMRTIKPITKLFKK